MSFFDLIAFFLYAFLFYFIVSVQAKKLKDARLAVFLRNAFVVKVFASFCYSLFVLYLSKGDTTTLYFPEGYNLYRLILKDPSKLHLLFGEGSAIDAHLLANPRQIGYFNEASNFMVIRVTALLCFLCFGKYMVVNLFFAMIGFTGIWKLYLFFYDQFPKLYKHLAIVILFLPTFTFWSSGILKEPIAIFALGWFTYAWYQLAYYKRRIVRHSLMVVFTIYLFTVIKVYILVAYLPAFFVFLLLKNAMLVRRKAAKVFVVISFLAISVFAFVLLSDVMADALVEYSGEHLTEGISSYQQNYQRQNQKSDGSYFSLGVEFNGTLGSLVRIAPAAVVATFFRPFLWESRNISTLLSSLESLVVMLFTLYVIFKTRPMPFLSTIMRQPVVLYSFIFSITFALFVGATTLNFGTLVRYKIPAMPFYLVSLILILYYNNKLATAPRPLPTPADKTV